MRFDFNFYSSILLIFFVHGLVYALMLFLKGRRTDSQSNKWLSAFLVLCMLYVSPWMLGFAGWYDNQPYRDILFYVPMQHLFFIGPVIFFYIQSLLNPSFSFGRKEGLQLIPGIVYIVYTLVIFVTDKVILKRYYFLADGSDRDFDEWYQYCGFLSMVIYFWLSYRYYQLYKKLMVQVISYADLVVFKWVKNFLLAFLAMLVMKLVFVVLSNFEFFQKINYIASWWDYFSFAIIFYYIAITGYSSSIETKVPFKINLLGQQSLLLLPMGTPNQTDSFIEDAEIIEFVSNQQVSSPDDDTLLLDWKPKILVLVRDERAYEDPELSLSQVARQLKTNPSIISKVINQGFKLNFNDFVNFYRIEAVKDKLTAGEQKTQTLLGIAYDCGFNSKATFNRAFKKAAGVSPKEWMAQN